MDSRNAARAGHWRGERLSRRGFIAGTAAVAAGGLGATWLVDAARTPPPKAPALTPIGMAMHVHASASEGPGSMQAQLVQAQRAGVDVLWWTEHDHRMAAHAAPTHIDFSGPKETSPGAAPWSWLAATEGNGDGRHTFCTRAQHPEIAPHDTALQLALQASSAGLSSQVLSGQAENWLNRTSLSGMTISVDVRPSEISPTAFLSVDVVTSYRPAYGGQPEGTYLLSYRVGGPGLPGTSKRKDDRSAVLYLDAPVGEWTTLTLAPELDLGRLWPGVIGRDAALFQFFLRAQAYSHRQVRGYFANLRFARADHVGDRPLAVQAGLIAGYAPLFPTVHQIQALEVSLTTPHLGWYGGDIEIPDYRGRGPLPSPDAAFARSMVQHIHASGGLASYCHPFGTGTPTLTAREQETARVAKSAELIANRALGCDLLEVGYRLRGGCRLAQHESVWDNCSRNGIALTGIGVSDDHKGKDWIAEELNFITWAWAGGTSQHELLGALRRGQVFFGDPARFSGALDIRVGQQSAMGAALISESRQQELTILATGLPKGAIIEVLRGTVDHAGAGNTTPDLVTTRLRRSDLDDTGTGSITIDTRRPRFVRMVVREHGGLAVAFSNPIWLLHRRSGQPFPRHRFLRSPK